YQHVGAVMDRDILSSAEQFGQNLLSRHIGRRALLQGAAAAVAYQALDVARAWADAGVGEVKVGVLNAVTPVANTAQPSLIDPGFAVRLVASGADPLENPSGVITRFGKLADNTNTEPDENTYLVFDQNPGGPSPGFDYGRHFLFQGHENAGNLAYV